MLVSYIKRVITVFMYCGRTPAYYVTIIKIQKQSVRTLLKAASISMFFCAKLFITSKYIVIAIKQQDIKYLKLIPKKGTTPVRYMRSMR